MTFFNMLEIFLVVLSGVLSLFCFSLMRRLRKLNSLEGGIGAAIAVMVTEIERFESILKAMRLEVEKVNNDLSGEVAITKGNAEISEFRKQIEKKYGSSFRMSNLRRQKRKQDRIDA